MKTKRFVSFNLISTSNIIIACAVITLFSIYLLITNPPINSDKFKIKECNYTIFEYDQIDYYHLDIDNFNGHETSQKDTIKRNIVNDYFNTISDSLNVDKIGNYYAKIKLNEKSLKFINSYICKTKKTSDIYFSECMPVFRDILVFRNKSKIVGINKICFECNISNLVSTQYNSYLFNIDEITILEEFLKVKHPY
ncbi:MAG: hypothetical protein Q8K02_17960 [Flavobacterium sp.]|nr:hypothetical protein [Flavobacterium sp.]